MGKKKKKRTFSISLDPADGHDNSGKYHSAKQIRLKVDILDDSGKRLPKKLRSRKSITLVSNDFCDKNGKTLGPITLKMYRFTEKKVYVGEGDAETDYKIRIQILEYDKKSTGGTYTIAWAAGLEKVDESTGDSDCGILKSDEEQDDKATDEVDSKTSHIDEPEEDLYNVSIGVKHLVLETKDIPALDKLDGDKWKRVSLIEDTKDPKKKYLLTNHRHKGSFGKVRYAMRLEGDDSLLGVKVFRLTDKKDAPTQVTERDEFEKEKDVMEKADAKVKFSDVIEVQKDKLGNPKNTLFAFMQLMASDLRGVLGFPDINEDDKKHIIAYMLREMAKDMAGLHNNLKRIHYDIKPANVMASEETVALIDYGCAFDLGKINSKELLLHGTPEYYHPLLFTGVDSLGKSDEMKQTIDVYAAVLSVVETIFAMSSKGMNDSSFWPSASDLEALPSIRNEYGTFFDAYIQHFTIKGEGKTVKRLDRCAKANSLLSFCLHAEDIEKEIADIEKNLEKNKEKEFKKEEDKLHRQTESLLKNAREDFPGLVSSHPEIEDKHWNEIRKILERKYIRGSNWLKDMRVAVKKSALQTADDDLDYWFGVELDNEIQQKEKEFKESKQAIEKRWARFLEKKRRFRLREKFKNEACKDHLLKSLEKIKKIDAYFYENILVPVSEEKAFGHEKLLEALEGNKGVDLEKGKKLVAEQLKKSGALDNQTAARELLLAARKKVKGEKPLVVSVPKVVQPKLIELDEGTSSGSGSDSSSGSAKEPTSQVVIETSSVSDNGGSSFSDSDTSSQPDSIPGLLHNAQEVNRRKNQRKEGHYQINSSYFTGVLNLIAFYQRNPSNRKLINLHKALCDWYFNMKDEKEYAFRREFAWDIYYDILEQAKKDNVKKILEYKDDRGIPFE